MIVLSQTRRIDWPRVLGNLKRCGMSPQQLADSIGVSRSCVRAYVEMDSEPAFWVGSQIITTWMQTTGLTMADLPIRTVTPSVAQVLRETA